MGFEESWADSMRKPHTVRARRQETLRYQIKENERRKTRIISYGNHRIKDHGIKEHSYNIIESNSKKVPREDRPTGMAGISSTQGHHD